MLLFSVLLSRLVLRTGETDCKRRRSDDEKRFNDVMGDRWKVPIILKQKCLDISGGEKARKGLAGTRESI
jgi:hypothetical protein